MSIIFWTLCGFVLGAIPFAPLIGRWLLGQDITQLGDKNPGATNVWRAGGFAWFSLALALDISKGALPVGLAYQVYGLRGWAVIPIAVAPILGHAYSPFLQGKGGKAIAAAFGVWMGLTLWQIPLVAMLLLILFSLLIKPSAWAVLMTFLFLLPINWFWLNDPVLLGAMVAQVVVLLVKQREELVLRPRIRLW